MMIDEMSRRDILSIEDCIHIAGLSKCKKKHGAEVTKGNRVFGTGFNILKTHPANPKQRSYHAEAVAIIHGNGNLKGGTLYSFRNGLWKLSKPCPDCMKMAKKHGIKYIVYSTENKIIKEKIQ